MGDQRGAVRQNVRAHVLLLPMAPRTLRVSIGLMWGWGAGAQSCRFGASAALRPVPRSLSRSAWRDPAPMGKQHVAQIFAVVRSRCSRDGASSRPPMPGGRLLPQVSSRQDTNARGPRCCTTEENKTRTCGQRSSPSYFFRRGIRSFSADPSPGTRGDAPAQGLWAQGRPRAVPGASPGNSGAGGRGQGCLSCNTAHRAGERQGSAPKKIKDEMWQHELVASERYCAHRGRAEYQLPALAPWC